MSTWVQDDRGRVLYSATIISDTPRVHGFVWGPRGLPYDARQCPLPTLPMLQQQEQLLLVVPLQVPTTTPPVV